MPSADQIENIVQTAAAAPVNNMIVLWAFGVLVFLIISAVILYKLGPLLIQLFKQQADTLRELKDGFVKLVEMKADTVEWQKAHSLAVEDTNKHLITLTQNIKTRSELYGQAYEEMREDVTGRVSGISTQIDTFESKVWQGFDTANENIANVKRDVEALRAEIDKLIDDKLKCAGLDEKIDAVLLRLDRLAQPTNAVSNVTVNTQPANVLTDDAPAKDAAA